MIFDQKKILILIIKQIGQIQIKQQTGPAPVLVPGDGDHYKRSLSLSAR